MDNKCAVCGKETYRMVDFGTVDKPDLQYICETKDDLCELYYQFKLDIGIDKYNELMKVSK